MQPADIDQRRTDEDRGRDNERRDCRSFIYVCTRARTSIKMSISSTTSDHVFFHIPACVYYVSCIYIILYSRIPEKLHYPYSIFILGLKVFRFLFKI